MDKTRRTKYLFKAYAAETGCRHCEVHPMGTKLLREDNLPDVVSLRIHDHISVCLLEAQHNIHHL